MNVIVCGGGETLLDDLKQCPEGIKISCNYHALHAGIECEYTVYTAKAIVEPLLDGYKTHKVCVNGYEGKKIRMFGYVGTAAVMFAIQWLKADRVYIAGVDLYTGKQKYCHPHEGKSGNEARGLANQKAWWNQCLKYLGDDINKLHPISGPLVEMCEQ